MSEGGSVSEERGVLLVVDDESTNIEVLNAVLEDGYDIIFATSGAEALERARTENPDLVLLDVVMPGMDGYEVCARLKANRHTAAIPVIFVTALDACADEARGLEAGAIDYVTKPISPPIVRARVRNHIELKRARDLLEKLSTTDGLTGLANRRHFDATLARECRSHHRGGKPLSLLLIDVDHFKIFNDTYGHVAGDACLKRVATSIAGSLERPRDLAARYGGEEFACILPETGHVGALAIAARIRTEIAGLGIVHDGSLVAQHVTASLGVATVSCINTVNPEDIVTLADAQLYRAKAAGRNRVHGVNAGDMPPAGTDSLIRGGDSRLAERQVEMEWLRRIRLALKENRFTLYFQRYQSLDSSAPDGEHREILLRMIGEDGRHIPPGELIPIAERYNLMPHLDRKVIRTAFAAYAAVGGADLPVRLPVWSINLSGTSLGDESLFDFIREQRRIHAIPAEGICFEITETAAISNLSKVADLMLSLKSTGFRFALDDFGSGLSSFSYLKALPVDYIKVDGSFVRNILSNATDHAMVEAMRHIGKAMGLKVVAEFVEDRTTLAALARIGIDYAQGYAVHRPAPLPEAPPFETLRSESNRRDKSHTIVEAMG